jgi:diguanylate cyclase (GGDEF)-like protein
MKMTVRLIHAVFFGACLLVYLSGLLIRNPDNNYAVLGLGMFVIVGQRLFSSQYSALMLGLSALAMAVLAFPLKSTSVPLSITSAAVSGAIYIMTMPFAGYMRQLVEREKALSGKNEALSRLKSVGMKHLQDQDDESEREIKEMSGIYSAVKELNFSMTLDASMETISEILKKVIKVNFGLQLEDVSFLVIFKREFDFYIAKSFGYDEEVLKTAEKQMVSAVLRNVSKGEELIYVPEVSEALPMSGMSMTKSLVYMPFHEEKKLLGVILITSVKQGLFSERQIENLKILSNQFAITMEKVHLYEEVAQMSITDGLTGLTVHRHFQEKLELELKRSERYGGNLALVMSDIDLFKKVNDTYGHLAGDYILKTIALIFKNHTSQAEMVARYGGEEFVIVFPDHDKDMAHMRAVKIRKDIESYKFMFNGQAIKVTMSMGVAAYPGDAITRRTLIDKADKALYKAKEEGRNRVIKAS